MTRESWRRSLVLPAALLAISSWLTACSRPDAQARESSSPPAPAPATSSPAFSECDLLTPAELNRAFRAAGYSKRWQYAKPHQTGWTVQCVYLSNGSGAPAVTVTVETGRSAGWLDTPAEPAKDAGGRPLPHAKPEPVANLGDGARRLVTYRETSGEHSAVDAVVRVRKGTTGLEIGTGVADAEDPASADFRSALSLSRLAIGRVGDPVEVDAETATGPCGKLDLAVASAGVGIQLSSSRSTVAGGVENCILAGRQGLLWIRVDGGSAAVERFRQGAAGFPAISGMGDEAYATPRERSILIGKRVVTVTVVPDDPEAYARGLGRSGFELMEPTEKELAFLRTVVAAYR